MGEPGTAEAQCVLVAQPYGHSVGLAARWQLLPAREYTPSTAFGRCKDTEGQSREPCRLPNPNALPPPADVAALPIIKHWCILQQELREELDIDVRVLGIASSSRMLLSEEGIDVSKWRDDFSQCVARSRALTMTVHCPVACCAGAGQGRSMKRMFYQRTACTSAARHACDHASAAGLA